jgi:hypothetical protein
MLGLDDRRIGNFCPPILKQRGQMRGTPFTRRFAIVAAVLLGLVVVVLLFVPIEGFQGGMRHDPAWRAPWRPREEVTETATTASPNQLAWEMDKRIADTMVIT